MTEPTQSADTVAPRPILLDLFCGAGGAAMGYHRAGFRVIGMDIRPQPNYPFEFHQADVMDGLAWPMIELDAVHASPPCQHWTAYRRRPNHVPAYPNLIGRVRAVLEMLNLPYVIENIPGARSELHNPIQLCGSSFGLDVQRHRLFESNVPMLAPPCDHGWQTPRFPPATNRKNLRKTVEVGVWRIPLAVQQKAMGIDWMKLDELSEAIPPAYTEWIGQHLTAAVAKSKEVAA